MLKKHLDRIWLWQSYCEALKSVRTRLVWSILAIVAFSDLIFGLLFYSFWAIPTIILTPLLFTAVYKRIEEKYLEHAWKFDWEKYASRNSFMRDRLGESDYKLAKVVFFHRFAYSLVFLVFTHVFSDTLGS